MKIKIPTALAVIALLIGVAAGILLLQNQTTVNIGAENKTAPENVRISNIDNGSFRVTWTTAKSTTSFLVFGEVEKDLQLTANDEISGASTIHSATATELAPNTNYSFTINIEGESFDNNGLDWQITTGSKLTDNAPSQPISGTVLTKNSSPADQALVYLIIGGASPTSAITNSSGNWVLPLGKLRSQDLSSYYEVTNETPLQIIVQSKDGTSTIYAFAQNLKPSETILIGESYDFRNESLTASDTLPKANIDLPQNGEQESSFDVKGITTQNEINEVTLQSLKEGEIVTSNSPEFFGEGPVGTKITITVHSDPQTTQFSVDQTGNWKWSPPEDLEEGTHKLVLSWTDENGILRSISKSFVVQAQSSPAYESTPSSTPTSSPSATPTATPTATAAPIPDSGTLTPTLVLSIMGIAMILFALFAITLSQRDQIS